MPSIKSWEPKNYASVVAKTKLTTFLLLRDFRPKIGIAVANNNRISALNLVFRGRVEPIIASPREWGPVRLAVTMAV